MGIERLREPCPKWAANEINRLRAERAAAQTIATRERAEADVQIERRIEVEAELAAKDARIAELEAAGNRLGDAAVEGALTSIEAVTELAETKARIAKLEDDVAHLCGQMAGKIGEGVAKDARIAELEGLLAYGTDTDAYRRIRARAERAEAHVVDLEEIVKGVHFLRKQAEAERDAMCDGNRPLPYDRDLLGRLVREAWVRWAYTQPNPKPSWLMNYDELTEPDKEADRQIGECIARWTLIGDAARAGPDGRNLAVLYCMERAEEDVKLLREALEGMIAVAEGRFDGNPHADIDALAKARAARDHSLAGEKS